jgi:hypothetical protein
MISMVKPLYVNIGVTCEKKDMSLSPQLFNLALE